MADDNEEAPDPKKAEGTNPAAAKQHVQLDDTPYRASAAMYHTLGWSPIPLPHRAKASPPRGWTGRDGRRPSRADVEAWAEDQPAANIAVRLPDNVVGIDVDAYGDKHGADTLDAAESRWGALPDTAVSTSRSDGVSGIRLFRVPDGTRLQTELPGGHVEVIQAHHRYLVAAPSAHPDGRTYRWMRGGVEVGIPTPGELPELPTPWLEALDAGQPDERGHAADVPLTDGPMAPEVEAELERAISDLAANPGQHHDVALRRAMALVRLAEQQYGGVDLALKKLCEVYAGLAGKRTPAQARQDFDRQVETAREKVAATPTSVGIIDLDDPDDVGAFCAGTALTRDHLVEALAAPLPVDPEVAFWNERPELTTIHDFALSRLVSPWSALGVVLARALSFVPPTVTLPALVGGRGSLNFYVLLAGESSSGKSAAFDVGDELLVPEPGYVAARRVNLGTGEGISAAFVRRGKAVEGVRQVVQFAESVTFEVDEIGKVVANVGRGSNLLDELCSAYFGKRLGQQTRDIERNLPLDAHAYRLTLAAGVLRRKAGVIVNDGDRGTPQRFVWLPTTWSAPPEQLPDEPEPIVLRRNLWTDRPTTVEVPDEVARTIRQTRRERLVTGTATLDGHELFTREKVAYALAVLAGRGDHFTLDDWRLAGVVMGVSRRVRDDLRRAVAEADAAAAAGRGRAQAIASDAATEHGADLHAQRVERVRARVVELLADGTPRTQRQLGRLLSGASQRAVLDEALTAGVDDGSVTESGVSRTGTALYSRTGVR